MIARNLRFAAAVAALVTLSACVGIKPVPPGPYAVGTHSVTVGRTWTDLGPLIGSPKAVRMLTIDGPALNSLFVIDGLKTGESIIRTVSKEKPMPTYKTGLTPVEQAEFITDSLVSIGYLRVETDNIRPVKIGDKDGVRVDITGQTAAGLNISGVAQLAEVNGRLYVLLYMAPAEHYFAATQAEVESVMASARISG
jgi:hypothetical protein